MRLTAAVAGLVCLTAVSAAWARIPDKPLGRISDFAEMLTETEESDLQGVVERVEKATGAQVAVVTVPSLDGLGTEEYANRLFQQWGIGRKGKDDGVLLLVALAEKKARIEVGYGLEGVLNDAQAGRILDEAVMPQIAAMNYGPALLAGTQQIAAAIAGDDVAAAPPAEEPIPGWVKIVFPGFLALFVTLGFLSFGAGFRGDWKSVVWGAIFGGIPLLLNHLAASALGYPGFLLPVWAALMALVGVVFGKRFLARYGGSWKVNVSIGIGGGRRGSGGSGSGGGFGGGASGGGGAGRS